MFSPDGRWIAYMSDESGAMEVYVRSFPSNNGPWRISIRGGNQPVWSQSARELFYVETETNTVMAVSFAAEADSFRSDQPRVWSPQPITSRGMNRAFDLHPDGRRIVMIKPPDVSPEQRDKVVMVSNFFDELRRLSATR